MGGWGFLACQICGFTAVLNFCHGLAVAYGSWWLHADSFETQIDEAQNQEQSLFNGMGAVASAMVVASLIGMVGLKLNTNVPRRIFLLVYFALLLVIMAVRFEVHFEAANYLKLPQMDLKIDLKIDLKMTGLDLLLWLPVLFHLQH